MTATTDARRTQTTLAQIIALQLGTKTRASAQFTEAYHTLQRTEPLSGISRSYQPRDDEGERLPPESKRVQVQVADVINKVALTLSRMFDVTLTKDEANTRAKADIVVDDTVIASDVPVTYLLTLEKSLIDLRTFFSKLPTLDVSEKWSKDETSDAWRTEPVETTRTKKIPRNHVRAVATDRHPAQVDVYNEDVVVGTWSTVRFSGAIPERQKAKLVEKVGKLLDAVKVAREAANTTTVVDQQIGDSLFYYLLA